MKKREQLVVLGALAGGILAGALLARRAAKATVYALPPPAPLLRLPVPPPINILPAPCPVTYEMVTVASSAPRRSGRLLGVSVAMLAVALLLAAAFLLYRPRVNALVAPRSALAGTSASILYSTSGAGRVEYRVNGAARRPSSALLARAGAIAIPLARSQAGHDLVVSLSMSGALGHDQRSVRIAIRAPSTPPRPPAPLRIDGLQLQTPFVAAGSMIVAHYRTNASRGVVTLTNTSGAVVQRTPLNASGFARFRVPIAVRDRPYIVGLTAEGAGHTLHATAGVVVAGAQPSPPPQGSNAGFFAPAQVRAGGLLRISIPPKLANARIALADHDGKILEQLTPGDKTVVPMRAPAVAEPGIYTVLLSYDQGKGTETRIRLVRIVP